MVAYIYNYLGIHLSKIFFFDILEGVDIVILHFLKLYNIGNHSE